MTAFLPIVGSLKDGNRTDPHKATQGAAVASAPLPKVAGFAGGGALVRTRIGETVARLRSWFGRVTGRGAGSSRRETDDAAPDAKARKGGSFALRAGAGAKGTLRPDGCGRWSRPDRRRPSLPLLRMAAAGGGTVVGLPVHVCAGGDVACGTAMATASTSRPIAAGVQAGGGGDGNSGRGEPLSMDAKAGATPASRASAGGVLEKLRALHDAGALRPKARLKVAARRPVPMAGASLSVLGRSGRRGAMAPINPAAAEARRPLGIWSALERRRIGLWPKRDGAPLIRRSTLASTGWRVADYVGITLMFHLDQSRAKRLASAHGRPAGSATVSPGSSPPPTVQAPPAAPPIPKDITEDEQQDAAPAAEPETASSARAWVEEAVAALPDKGDPDLPEDVEALARLLADPPPTNDFTALDLLHRCYPRGTTRSRSRVLLAVAQNLTRNFGLPGRLPMASSRAWQMLDADIFVDDFAAQTAAINKFIFDWQSQQKEFLVLNFGEIALIEHLFEHLHPRRHGLLLAKVMDFKVLSSRRFGLIRRIPVRVERVIRAAKDDKTAEIQYAKDSLLLLEYLSRPEGFAPIIEESKAAAAKVVAMLKALLPPPPGAEGGPQMLGAIAPPQSVPQPAVPVAAPVQAPAPVRPVATVPSVPAVASPPGRAAAQPAAPAPQSGGLTVSVGMVKPVARGDGDKKAADGRTAAVLRVLGGETCEQVGAALGIDPAQLAQWRDQFIAAGTTGLVPRPQDSRDLAIAELRETVDRLTQAVERLTLQAKAPVAALPAPDKPKRRRAPAKPRARKKKPQE